MDDKLILYKTTDNQVEIRVRFDEETVWLNQKQIIKLFERDQSVISRHINNVFKEGELDKKSNMQKMHIPNSDKPIFLYNLDVIISVGYREKSQRGTQFRQWATQRLKDYLVKGYAINEKRLHEKEQEVLHLKTGIQILSRAIEAKNEDKENELSYFFCFCQPAFALRDNQGSQRTNNTSGNATTQAITSIAKRVISYYLN